MLWLMLDCCWWIGFGLDCWLDLEEAESDVVVTERKSEKRSCRKAVTYSRGMFAEGSHGESSELKVEGQLR
jgi:hypothetical protein